MARWTVKELNEIDNISFAIAILNERRQSTTNVYSPLNTKISLAIRELDHIKSERIKERMNHEDKDMD